MSESKQNTRPKRYMTSTFPSTPPCTTRKSLQDDAQKRSIYTNHAHPFQCTPPTSPGHPTQPQRNNHPEPTSPLAPPDQSPARCNLRRVLLNLVRDHRKSAIPTWSRKAGLKQDKLQRLFPRHNLGFTDPHVRTDGHRPPEQMAHRGQPARRTTRSRRTGTALGGRACEWTLSARGCRDPV